MPERSFEEARRAVERARRALEQQAFDARAIGEQAVAEAVMKMAGGRARGQAATEEMLRAIQAVRKGQRPGGRGSGPNRPGDPGPSPQPAPVRPKFPSSLTGGAEAPVDP